MTIGTPVVIFAVLTVFDDWYTVGTNSVPIVKIIKNSQKTVKSQNSKNDHWCTNRHMSTQSPPNTQSLRTRPKFSKTVMVSVGVTKLGCTELFFVEPGVKINGAYYRDLLLAQKLLPVIRQISVNEFVFQQDSAPAHRARAQRIY